MNKIFAIAIVGLAACSPDRASGPSGVSRTPGAANAARTPTLSAVSLVVAVDDADSLGSSYGIQSDGQGVYVDGTQNVQASIDKYGTFAFNTRAATRKAASRWVHYSFENPVDPSNTYRPAPSDAENYHFSTGGTSFAPWVPLQNLGVNGNPSTQCGYMGNGFSNSTTGWRVSFHKGLEDIAGSATAFAVFTRVSVSPAVWTVEPVGSCTGNANVASLRNSATGELYGYYYVPFRFTLTAK
jgi:hypothetical protein